MYDAVADEYCYSGTTVLKNKLDLRDAAELAEFEAEVSDARADEEAPAPVPGRLRLGRRNTHGPHFEGREHVLLPGIAQLKKDKFLAGLEPDEFAEKAAHFLSELNVIHARYRYPGSSLRDHGPHPRKRHEARTDREERRASARLQVPAPRQEAPGVSGPGLSPQEAGPVRSWLFLARSWMQAR